MENSEHVSARGSSSYSSGALGRYKFFPNPHGLDTGIMGSVGPVNKILGFWITKSCGVVAIGGKACNPDGHFPRPQEPNVAFSMSQGYLEVILEFWAAMAVVLSM